MLRPCRARPLPQLGSASITWAGNAFTLVLVASMPPPGGRGELPIYFNQGDQASLAKAGFCIIVYRSIPGSPGTASVRHTAWPASCPLSGSWNSSWTFVTLVVSGSTMTLYEGVFTTSATPTPICTKTFFGGAYSGAYTTPNAYLGYRTFGDGGFTGHIAAFAVWPTRALTASELASVHSSIQARTGI